MAFFVNKQNVLLYCVARRDQVLLLKASNPSKQVLESYSVKCPSSKAISKSSTASHLKEHYVVATAISNCGKFIAACDSNNLLHLWEYDTNTWNHKSERQLFRKCQKIIFTNSGSDVIVADRSGDVFVYSVLDFQKEGKFLLGHISLIIDVVISSDDSYLLTCDRDGKVRISCYPNSYNIYNYCLGHEEFVSSVQCIDLSKELILTSSGDGSVRLWDFNGDIVCWVNLFENEILCKNIDSCKSREDSKTTLSCLLDEKQITFAVKSVRYSFKNKIFAILFYLLKGVAIYCITDIKENFKFVQFITVESIPFDVFFDLTGNLAILQKNTSKQYSYFRPMEEDGVYFKEVDSDTVPLFNEFKKICENIENLHEFHDNCDTLFKRNFDDKDDNVETKSNISKKSKTDVNLNE